MGWVSNDTSADASVNMPSNTSTNAIAWAIIFRHTDDLLAIGYLRSYEGFGRARVWLDDDAEQGIILDGRWSSRVSLPDLFQTPTAKLCGSSCKAINTRKSNMAHSLHKHALHIAPIVDESRPNKFKLTMIQTCIRAGANPLS